ncbi:hypothetical protein ACFOGI_08995 [Virgibacillus xinjiangensis]|uniref:Uncharacterized protein n=1 Tax=Virgibacillus xinjiangensis TaxID=393090 RepID=A0ABV7CVS0_9BACI
MRNIGFVGNDSTKSITASNYQNVLFNEAIGTHLGYNRCLNIDG